MPRTWAFSGVGKSAAIIPLHLMRSVPTHSDAGEDRDSMEFPFPPSPTFLQSFFPNKFVMYVPLFLELIGFFSPSHLPLHLVNMMGVWRM